MESLLDTLIWLLLRTVVCLLECYEALRAAVGVAMVAVAGGLAQLAEQLGRAIASFLLAATVVVAAAVAACVLAISRRRRAVAPAAA